jgi:hypothetical protein
MPDSAKAPARRRSSTRTRRTVVRVSAALMVIDHERLQSAAWAEFHTAQKRLEKTTRDLHRHEEIDVPAYESWLHRTFPIQVTTLRELHAQVIMKGRKIQEVQAQAMYSGGSLKRLWRQQKEREANPEKFEEERESEFRRRERTDVRPCIEDPGRERPFLFGNPFRDGLYRRGKISRLTDPQQETHDHETDHRSG